MARRISRMKPRRERRTKMKPAIAASTGTGYSHMRNGRSDCGVRARHHNSPADCNRNCNRIRITTSAAITSASRSRQNAQATSPSASRETCSLCVALSGCGVAVRLGEGFAAARARAYEAVRLISFDGMQVRPDIAERAVKAQAGELDLFPAPPVE